MCTFEEERVRNGCDKLVVQGNKTQGFWQEASWSSYKILTHSISDISKRKGKWDSGNTINDE